MKKIFSILSVIAIALGVASCSSNVDELANEVGYLMLGIETNGTTMTRAGAPAGYDARKLHVEVRDAQNTVVASTDDFANDDELNGAQITLTPGQYTVVAHSANWDGSGSGFDTPYYYGETTVTVKTRTLTTAKVTCTLANVKVTVNFSQEFQESFARAKATIESAVEGVSTQTFNMGSDRGSAYFPVGDLTATLNVWNNNGEMHGHEKVITGVQARDHYIINYTVAAHGYQGGVTVQVDPTTKTYTYTFEVPRKGGTGLAAYTANAWSTFATLTGAVTGKKPDFDATKLKMRWKAADAADWTEVANSNLTIDGDDVSCKITGLTPETDYVYRLVYVTDAEEANSPEISFTTEAQTALYNGSFEEWHYETSKEIAYATDAKETKYWSSSNPGSGKALASLAKMTDKTTDYVHGGTYAAKLASGQALGFLAAASLYTGSFGALDMASQTASLNWGVPFTSRPTALKGYMIYKPGNVDIVNATAKDGTPLPSEAPGEGEPDHCQIYCALLDINAPLAVDNGNLSTFPDWNTDPRVIAYGALTQTTTQNAWTEFTINLAYHDLTKTPKYLLIVCSAGKYGDYFHGSSSSVLYVDDFELIYGDTPTVQN